MLIGAALAAAVALLTQCSTYEGVGGGGGLSSPIPSGGGVPC